MKAFAFVLVAAVVCAVAFGAEHSGTSGDLEWTIKDNVLTFTGTGSMEDYASYSLPEWSAYGEDYNRVVIKDGAKNIGSYAFASNIYIKEVSCGASLVSIGSNAFSSCTNLTTVTLNGEMVLVSSSAFAKSAITDLTFSCNDCTVEGNVFDSCKNLNTVIIKGKNMAHLSASAFSNCSSLERVAIPNVTEIEGDAFSTLDVLDLVYYMGNTNPCDESDKVFTSCPSLRVVVVPTYYNSTEFCGKHAKIVSTTTSGASSVALSALVMLLSVFLFLW